MEHGAPELGPALQRRVERAGAEFLAGFFETELRQKPENLAALVELGHLYTRLGRVREGLSVDRELARRLPDDPTVRYNLACSLALNGELDAAFAELGHALERGYRDAEHLAQDEDLAALRADPRFEALLARLGELGADPGA
jgi:Flp pilus assembly protein TadD